MATVYLVCGHNPNSPTDPVFIEPYDTEAEAIAAKNGHEDPPNEMYARIVETDRFGDAKDAASLITTITPHL